MITILASTPLTVYRDESSLADNVVAVGIRTRADSTSIFSLSLPPCDSIFFAIALCTQAHDRVLVNQSTRFCDMIEFCDIIFSRVV